MEVKHDVAPSAQGLLRCLQALAEEAAKLAMVNTSQAIQGAVLTCLRESLSETVPPRPCRALVTVH